MPFLRGQYASISRRDLLRLLIVAASAAASTVQGRGGDIVAAGDIVSAEGPVAGPFPLEPAAFGPRVGPGGIVGDLFVSVPADACRPLDTDGMGVGPAPGTWIALVERSPGVFFPPPLRPPSSPHAQSCTFLDKVNAVEAAGGRAAIGEWRGEVPGGTPGRGPRTPRSPTTPSARRALPPSPPPQCSTRAPRISSSCSGARTAETPPPAFRPSTWGRR